MRLRDRVQRLESNLNPEGEVVLVGTNLDVDWKIRHSWKELMRDSWQEPSDQYTDHDEASDRQTIIEKVAEFERLIGDNQYIYLSDFDGYLTQENLRSMLEHISHWPESTG